MRIFLAAAAFLIAAAAPAVSDPYLWLEEIEGARALDWVRVESTRSREALESAKGFAAYQEKAAAILNDRSRLSLPRVAGDDVLNFWQDQTHVRGLWRASEKHAFQNGTPQWRTLIDLDALAEAEARNWVWRGANCLPPAYARCMIALSDGGKDAVVWREFDRDEGRFVADGFQTSEAKTDLVWLDNNTLLIVSDFGPGTLNTSGYGRQVRRWARGTQIAAASLLYEAPADDVWLRPVVERDGARTHVLLVRSPTTWTSEFYYLGNGAAPPRRLPLPEDAAFQVIFGDRMIARLQSPLPLGARTIPTGSLVAYRFGAPEIERVYEPGPGESVASVAVTQSALYVGLLHDVAARLVAITPWPRWRARAISVAPDSALALVDAEREGETLYYTTQGLTRPETLYAVDGTGAPHTVSSMPPRFKADAYSVQQAWATSTDGTRVPYFIVRPKQAEGPLPTLVHAYGGFRQPMLPIYLSALAQLWLEGGNAYVIANVRGGGEFGPEWHAAAVGAGRQKSYDDVHAVSAALKASGASSRIGVYGASNGGLLASAVMLQRPGLYDAAVISVPLTDMKRYSKLLAGASWMAEYGDPERSEDWNWLRRYSPYHNVRQDRVYPRPFILTSTKDDRVHPGHARKFAARLQEQGHAFYYYENVDGGHAGSANRGEQAHRTALILSYLNRELGRKPAPRVPASDTAWLNAQQAGLLRYNGPDWHATASGLRYRIVRATPADAPRPQLQDTVTVHYVGRFLDGKVFDSSRARGAPVTFPITNVVRGWREALVSMRVGEVREIALPAALGYGPAGRGEIPGGATLVFEIELIRI